MLHEFGVRTGRISMNRFVELTSTNVAKRFGLYPRKGTIAVGSDADLVVWDPEKKLTISAETHHSNVNYNLFEGTEVTGAPQVVLVRGQVIVENDELVAEPGAGQFVKRARVGEQLGSAAEGRGVSDEEAQEVYAKARARPERHARVAPRRPRGRLQLRVHRSGVHARLGHDRRGRGDEAAARRRPGEGAAGRSSRRSASSRA